MRGKVAGGLGGASCAGSDAMVAVGRTGLGSACGRCVGKWTGVEGGRIDWMSLAMRKDVFPVGGGYGGAVRFDAVAHSVGKGTVR